MSARPLIGRVRFILLDIYVRTDTRKGVSTLLEVKMCLYPVKLNIKREVAENGDVHTFSALADKETPYTIPVKCGKCIECQKSYSREWALRMFHDYEDCGQVGFFLTLTYEKTDGDLHIEDVQRFLKRFRKVISPVKIRYFMCGEYGSKCLRPHYHLAVFGFKPSDMVIFCERESLYTSSMIDRLWRGGVSMPSTRVAGFHSIGNIDFDNLVYVAKYLQKFQNVDGKYKPFTTMSRRPGLGLKELHHSPLGVFYVRGQKINEPRRYLEHAALNGIDVQSIRENRVERAKILERSKETLECLRLKEKTFIHNKR